MRQGVAGLVEGLADAGGVEAEVSWILQQRPGIGIGVVVPSPLHTQGEIREGIVRRQVGNGMTLPHIRLLVELGRRGGVAHVPAILAEGGPSVLTPGDGFEVRHAAYGSGILEEHRPPLARLGFHEGTLVDMLSGKDTAVGIVVRLGLHTLLVLTHGSLRTEDGLATLSTSVGGIDVVVVADVVHVASLQTAVGTGDDLRAAYLLQRLGIELVDPNVIDTTGYVEVAVALLTVVEEPAGIVVVLVHVLHVPLALGVDSRQQDVLAFVLPVLAVGDEVDIELAIMIVQGGGPLSLGIVVLTVQQVVVVIVVDLLQGIGTVLPVHEVLTLEQRAAREDVEGGADHIVGVTHADDIGVGEVTVEDGVDEGGTIVGCPATLVGSVGMIHLKELLIPVEAGHTATVSRIQSGGLHGILESRIGFAQLEGLVNVEVATRGGEGHGDVLTLVQQGLVAHAPLGGGTRGPGAKVALYPLTVLVVMTR